MHHPICSSSDAQYYDGMLYQALLHVWKLSHSDEEEPLLLITNGVHIETKNFAASRLLATVCHKSQKTVTTYVCSNLIFNLNSIKM